MINPNRMHIYFVLLTLWIILVSVWMSLDSIFAPEFGPTNLEFIFKAQTQIWLALCFLTSIPIAIYLERNVQDRLILCSVLVFVLIWLFSSGISYLSAVIDEQYSGYWDVIVALVWGVMFLALVQLVEAFYLVFYFCIAILYCYVLSELLKKINR